MVDWFGFDFTAQKREDGILISLKASLKAMEFWAMQYLNAVQVLTPLALRKKIEENVLAAAKKYSDER